MTAFQFPRKGLILMQNEILNWTGVFTEQAPNIVQKLPLKATESWTDMVVNLTQTVKDNDFLARTFKILLDFFGGGNNEYQQQINGGFYNETFQNNLTTFIELHTPFLTNFFEKQTTLFQPMNCPATPLTAPVFVTQLSSMSGDQTMAAYIGGAGMIFLCWILDKVTYLLFERDKKTKGLITI